MIPTVLVIGSVGGFFLPTRGLWVVAAASVLWVGTVLMEGSITPGVELLGSTALGAVNAATGFAVGLAVRHTVG